MTPMTLTGAPLAPYAQRTLNALFLHAVGSWPELPALGNAASPARLTFAEVEERVFRLATALAARGVAAGDRVAILSENRPEWAIADYAVLSLGAVTVPLYPTLPAGQVAEILADAAAKVVFVSDAAQATKVLAAGAAAG
ncbi:MAG TPA: AMP-binding protein, partial [Longimicrobiales bacterium]